MRRRMRRVPFLVLGAVAAVYCILQFVQVMPSGGEGYQELFRHDTGNRPREPPAGDDILKRYRNTGHEADQNSMRDGPFVAGPQTQSQGQKRICDEKDRTAVGEIHFNRSHYYTEAELEVKFTEVKVGGHWSPEHCVNNETLAVIIPFRDVLGDRHRNLMVLLRSLHTLLQRQRRTYSITVVQQNGTRGFINKGLLMNLGFQYVMTSSPTWPRSRDVTCVVFHDVDVVPVDDRNPYTCGDTPRHLVGNLNNQTTKPFFMATGGALILSPLNFTHVNGFSNRYWGWGNEDDDLFSRIVHHKLKLVHANSTTGRYLHLPHKRSYKSTNYRPAATRSRWEDGLSALNSVPISTQYKLLNEVPHKLYTWLNFHFYQPGLS